MDAEAKPYEEAVKAEYAKAVAALNELVEAFKTLPDPLPPNLQGVKAQILALQGKFNA